MPFTDDLDRVTPRILIIAGSDSGGGAGIQADIKTVTMLGGHAMTAITAVTAQNTLGVDAVHLLPPAMVRAQIDAVAGDIGYDAVKIGMLGSPAIAATVADWLESVDAPVVFDPVMVATSGAELADAGTIAGFERLMRLATVTTPNSDELSVLAGGHDGSDLGMFEAAAGLAERYSTSILATGTIIRGGVTYQLEADAHTPPEPTEHYLYDRLFTSDPQRGFQQWEWPGAVINTVHDHGTGCTLASAIAVGLAEGATLPQAIERARRFVRGALLAAPGIGQGHGPMGHQAVTEFLCRT